MRRSAEELLTDWIRGRNRKPLVIRGARQVGKSTLVRRFVKSCKRNLLEINLERHAYLDRVFRSLDIQRICRELEGIWERKIESENSVLFLDEIQSAPYALPALRYFYEELPKLPVLAAGSLLEFALSKHNFSMPVGRVEYLHLGPMTFEEYLFEIDPNAGDFVAQFRFGQPIPLAVHRKLLHHQRDFLLVGGMPEAIHAYAESGDFTASGYVQQSILSTYQDDFAKYATQKSLARLQRIFQFLPKAVGRKVKYSQISKEEKARETKFAIELLQKARLITAVQHSSCNGIPLIAEADEFTYKLLFLDVGLMNRLLGLDWIAVNSMDENELVNEGPIAEQFVGQHLIYRENLREAPNLQYWLRERKSANAEVDYVISQGKTIAPVEVKAGKSGTMKSMLQFVHSKNVSIGIRFDLNLPSVRKVSHRLGQAHTSACVQYTLISLPLYLVGKVRSLLDEYRQGRIEPQQD